MSLYSEIPPDFILSKETMHKWEWEVSYTTTVPEKMATTEGQTQNIALDIYYIQDLPHTKHSRKGVLCLWACPRGEIPNHHNLVMYAGHGCRWGIEVVEVDAFYPGNGFHKPTEYRDAVHCWITRNGERFYPVREGRTISEALIAAQYKMSQLHEHAIAFFERDWQTSVMMRKVWYKDQPAVIKRLDQQGGMAFLAPDPPGQFSPPWYAKTDDEERRQWASDYGDGLWVDILDERVVWVRK